uniref:Secreted protein n=1 Tax=Cacopsylla melanoneura TaxID=428564 RepID=A0A8D8ZQ89_9HEMI
MIVRLFFFFWVTRKGFYSLVPFLLAHSITSLDHTDGINVLIRRGPQLVFLEKAVKDIIPIQYGHPEQIGKGTFLGLKYRSTTKDISRGMRKVKRRHSSA